MKKNDIKACVKETMEFGSCYIHCDEFMNIECINAITKYLNRNKIDGHKLNEFMGLRHIEDRESWYLVMFNA